MHQAALMCRKWDRVILDESHAAKNFESHMKGSVSLHGEPQ